MSEYADKLAQHSGATFTIQEMSKLLGLTMPWDLTNALIDLGKQGILDSELQVADLKTGEPLESFKSIMDIPNHYRLEQIRMVYHIK